jgi:putative ABC transport system substrate-binding protein
MRRREFIAGVATAVWPFTLRAKTPAHPVIGFLHSASLQPNANLVTAFRKGLFDAGFVEGQSVVMEFRWANGQVDRLSALANDLVSRKVSVIATPGSTPAALAAKAATADIPIVFAIGGDPVALDLVASLNRPGSNVTGVSFESVAIGAKALGIFRQLVPKASRIVALVNPDTAFTNAVVKNVQAGAAALGLKVEVFHASTDKEVETVFAAIAQQPGTAARYALPTMYVLREFTADGGLISYGPDLTNAYREAGNYTGRILKGEKAAEIPVELPTKFQLVINLKTAKALALTVPDNLLALADEVIE